jgi:hypothetical protein
MDGRHRDAVTVEIAYALVPSLLLVLFVAGVVAFCATALHLQGQPWSTLGAIALVAAAVTAVVRAVLVLVRAHHRGL